VQYLARLGEQHEHLREPVQAPIYGPRFPVFGVSHAHRPSFGAPCSVIVPALLPVFHRYVPANDCYCSSTGINIAFPDEQTLVVLKIKLLTAKHRNGNNLNFHVLNFRMNVSTAYSTALALHSFSYRNSSKLRMGTDAHRRFWLAESVQCDPQSFYNRITPACPGCLDRLRGWSLHFSIPVGETRHRQCNPLDST